MSHINGKGLESRNEFYIFHEGLDVLITQLDQQNIFDELYQLSRISQRLKLHFQTV
jgi:hypothetical protein